nr:MAG TPA: Mitochondrial Calcium Uniporter channel, mitochondria, pentamer, N-terminal [Bacteriophage sp.]
MLPSLSSCGRINCRYFLLWLTYFFFSWDLETIIGLLSFLC